MGFSYVDIDMPLSERNVLDTSALPEDVGLGELFNAWFETENSLGSLMAITHDEFARDKTVAEGYDPLDDIWGTEFDKPENRAYFSKARNPTELQRMIHHHVRETENRDLIARASLGQNLPIAFVTGLLDPLMAPFAAIPMLRGSLLARSIKAAGMGIAEAATEELALTPTQNQRTINESLWNMGATGVMAGAFGALLGKVAPEDVARITKKIDEEINAPVIDSAGAARVVNDGEGSRLVLNKAFKATRRASPSQYVATAQVPEARALGRELANDAFLRLDDVEGEAAPFSYELMSDVIRKEKSVEIYSAFSNGFSEYKAAVKQAGGKAMSKDEFERAVLMAVENDSLDPIIEKAAAPIRNIYKEIGDGLAKHEMIPDIMDEAIDAHTESIGKATNLVKKLKKELDSAIDENELLRLRKMKRTAVANLKKNNGDPVRIAELKADVDTLSSALGKAGRKRSLIERDLAKAETDLDALKKSVPQKAGVARVPQGAKHYLPSIHKPYFMAKNKDLFVSLGIDEYVKKYGGIDPATREEIEMALLETADNIMYNRYDYAPGGTRIKFTKQRTIEIPREVLRKHGFLEDDPYVIWEAYSRRIIPELIMRENGFDFGKRLRDVSDRYMAEIERAEKAGKTRRANFLRGEKEGVESRLQGMYDMIAGKWDLPDYTNAKPRAIARLLMEANIYTKLGSVTFAAIPDSAHVMGRVGFRRLSKGMAQLANFSADAKLTKEQVKKMAVIAETTLATIARHRNMLDDSIPFAYKANIKSSQFTSQFITLTGQNHWNQMMRMAHGLAYSDELMDIASSGAYKKMSKGRVARFAANGIGKDDWDKIAAEYAKHGKDVSTASGTLRVPNFDDWDDRALARKLRFSLAKEVEFGVLAPGVGDLFLNSRKTVGKMAVQFKTFQFASTNKILFPGLQRMSLGGADAYTAVSGLLSSIAMGAVVYGLKSHLAGREPSDDPGLILKEAIDRSGYFGYFSDANTILDKLTKGHYSLTSWLSEEEMSRYYTRSVIGDILGPSLGTLDDARRTMGVLTDISLNNGVDPAELKGLRRLIPYQNHFMLRNMMFNPAEEKLNEVLQ